jgi:hypothetical protein
MNAKMDEIDIQVLIPDYGPVEVYFDHDAHAHALSAEIKDDILEAIRVALEEAEEIAEDDE